MTQISLYQYSQLCCIVETLVLATALLFIGRAKVRNTHWLKFTKTVITIVLASVGVFTTLQYAFNMSLNYPRIDTALNITMLYLITFLFSIIFLPLAATSHVTRMRLIITALIFTGCAAMVWVSVDLDNILAQIALFVSLAVYFFELVRIMLSFGYHYKILEKRERPQGSEDEARFVCLRIIAHSIALLSIFAVIYVFLVLMSTLSRAFFNYGMLLVWGYLFVSFVDLIINYNPLTESNIHLISNDVSVKSSLPHPELEAKIDEWVNSGAYRQQGINMTQVADVLSTNRTYLSQYINARYGTSFNNWITRLRIDEAKRLMLDSPTLSIDRVALAAGFSTKSHFMSTFKSIVGMTPGQWRNSNH